MLSGPVASWRSLDPATIQRHQLLNLIFLFAVGKLLLNLPITWLETGLIVGFAIAVDHLLIYLKARRLDFFSYSAVNTALGVAFLLRAVEFEIYLIVVVLALAQKHWLRIDGRHFFNPSNVAVVAGLMLFPYATYTTPEQWGGQWWLGAAMTVLGLFITYRVGRVLIPLVFTAAYLALTYTFITHNTTEILFTLVSGSFLLFIYFMLTDPRSTPDHPGYQILYAVAIATLTTVLEPTFGARDITMFLALFIVSMFVPLMRIGQARRAHAWRYVLGGVAVGVAAVAFSPLNTLNQLPTTSAVQVEAQAPDAASDEVALPSEPIAWNGRPDWYQTRWEDPHAVSAPLTPQPRDHGFTRISGVLDLLTPRVRRRHIGMDYTYHGPISAGDINHDGKLDLALGVLGRGLTILINRGEGSLFAATEQLFETVPKGNVDQIALADFDGDSHLDLLISFNPYEDPTAPPNRLYRFDPASRTFVLAKMFPHPVRATLGGDALIDINGDRILDPYIALAHDWHKADKPPSSYMRSDGVANQFWISGNGDWRERKTEYFPQPFEEHAGMTAMFTDLNGDGRPDFLLGNDLQPDLSYFMGADGIFALIPRRDIEYNSLTSMGYMGIDADNDGALEIWENSISLDVLTLRTRYGEYLSAEVDDDLFTPIVRNQDLLSHDCTQLRPGLHRDLCLELQTFRRAVRTGDRALCDQVVNQEERNRCRYLVDNPAYSLAHPEKFKQDVERFPRKVKKNILLKLAPDGRYLDVLGNDNAALTGWSWAAFPFDLDNNGFQDLFITTGMAISAGNAVSALLMNHSTPGHPSLVNQARLYGVDFLDEDRGVIAADLDGDGDGDLVINNLYTPPIHLEGRFGGDAVVVELRSQRGNYYGIGSRVELRTNRGIQVREMAVGGVWDSMQPQVLHFGLAEGEKIDSLTVRWPYGESTTHEIEPNRHYVIYD
ncbi:MAG: hypothetical protein AUJ55_04265 [Proteobacteria bacterium CG1_02_64_396]|nr:MAG: hypothetical protein AUJ55_04265 [Proteobacteria bacterium CG1_02_64_396]